MDLGKFKRNAAIAALDYVPENEIIGIGLKYDRTLYFSDSRFSQSEYPNENSKVAIITPDKEIVANPNPLSPAYIVFDNYEIILKWNRSLRFALAVCTLKDKIKNEL